MELKPFINEISSSTCSFQKIYKIIIYDLKRKKLRKKLQTQPFRWLCLQINQKCQCNDFEQFGLVASLGKSQKSHMMLLCHSPEGFISTITIIWGKGKSWPLSKGSKCAKGGERSSPTTRSFDHVKERIMDNFSQ